MTRRRTARLRDALAAAVSSTSLAAGLALFSAVLAVPAFLTAGVKQNAVTHADSGTPMLKEPYLDYGWVRADYHDAVPRVVELAVRDFDQGANVDLTEDTQDYQTRYSPAITCEENPRDVVALYGRGACEPGSSFYARSTQYERGLIVLNGRGDPATSANISLGAKDLRQAARVLRRAEAELVACAVRSAEKRPVNVTVSASSGYVVAGEKTFTLPARGSRRVIIQPDQSVAGAAIGEAGCTVDYDLTSSAKNAATPRWWIAGAGLVALASFALGVRARQRGKVKE